MSRIVIIGASISGHTAAVKLREIDKGSSITLLTEESYPLYDRRRFFDFLTGSIEEKDIFLSNEDFYQRHNINFLKDKKVISLNTEKRTVYFKEKDSIEYDYLIIASGRKPTLPEMPGAKKPGVFTLYLLDDYKEFLKYIISESVCVVGSNQIALSLARAIVSRYKIEVKLICSENLGETDSEGIEILNIPLQEIIGEGSAQAIKLKSGKVIGVSCVIFMDEFKGNIDFLRNTDIEIYEDSIRVNDKMQTNIEGIFASGAVATSKDTIIRLKSWDEAVNDSLCLVDKLRQREL
jgi:NAD(P)H-nitrite reductase large subunit